MKKFIYVLLLCICLIPLNVNAEADSLKELRDELQALKDQKAKNDQQAALTQSQINTNKTNIANAYAEIEESERQIAEAKEQIAQTNTEISELELKNQEIMKFYQIMNGDNLYVDFITDSTSMTEIIMKSDAINLLVTYVKDQIFTLEEKIEQNEQLEIDLLNYENQLEDNIANYKNKINGLEANLNSILDVALDIDDQIDTTQSAVEYYAEFYKSANCKESESFDSCFAKASLNGSATWLKPLVQGRITSLFGPRISPITGKQQVHYGTDIGGNSEGTNVYAVANGTVAALVKKGSCGGNQVFLNVVVGGKKYTVFYAHLLTINVSKGQSVNVNTVIGTVGGGKGTSSWDKCSTGAHLHFAVAEGFYTTWSNYIANNIKPPGFPNSKVWFYSRTQWFN